MISWQMLNAGARWTEIDLMRRHIGVVKCVGLEMFRLRSCTDTAGGLIESSQHISFPKTHQQNPRVLAIPASGVPAIPAQPFTEMCFCSPTWRLGNECFVHRLLRRFAFCLPHGFWETLALPPFEEVGCFGLKNVGHS